MVDSAVMDSAVMDSAVAGTGGEMKAMAIRIRSGFKIIDV